VLVEKNVLKVLSKDTFAKKRHKYKILFAFQKIGIRLLVIGKI